MMHTPPRLLAGFTLLVWGGLSGHTTWGLIAAVLLESKSWINLRWDFNRASYIKAWQFSILVGAFITMVAWINGLQFGKLHTLFKWAPLILLPLELTQRYGKASNIPLNTFSFFARRKMSRDIKLGRTVSPKKINTGYPYIIVTLLATAMASQYNTQHFVFLSITTAACLYFSVRNAGFRPWAWSVALLLTLIITYAGHFGMYQLYNRLTGISPANEGQATSTNETLTSIGKLGKIKLSPQIYWRMVVHQGNTPKLLRTASYNRYSRTRWMHKFDPPADDSQREENDYLSNIDISNIQDRDIRSFVEMNPDALTQKGHVSITGQINSRMPDNPIPHPHNTHAIGDLGPEPSLEVNSLGTIRISNPENHVINFTVWTGNGSTTEEPPNKNYDLAIPASERDSISRIVAQLNLDDPSLSTRAIILRLRHFFNTRFSYTTHLQTAPAQRGNRHAAIGTFLEQTRAGHCEYFATATALILRHLGIPARYSVGFAVHEFDEDRGEWVMRGEHAHAWCRAWIKETHADGTETGAWEDVDLTPAAWHLADQSDNNNWKQQLADWWQRFREDFLIWRTREANQSKVTAIIVALVAILLVWIIWRLWHSKQRQKIQRSSHRALTADNPGTPLNKIEKQLSKIIGARSPGQPLCHWTLTLANHQPQLTQDLKTITELHSKIRFDPETASQQDATELDRLVTRLRQSLRA